jgi:hypothetical protein
MMLSSCQALLQVMKHGFIAKILTKKKPSRWKTSSPRPQRGKLGQKPRKCWPLSLMWRVWCIINFFHKARIWIILSTEAFSSAFEMKSVSNITELLMVPNFCTLTMRHVQCPLVLGSSWPSIVPQWFPSPLTTRYGPLWLFRLPQAKADSERETSF